MDVKLLWENEKQLKSVTGLTKNEAQILYQDFSSELNKKEEKKERIGGRPNKLPMLEFFVMLMFYIRHHPTFPALGGLFGIATSNAKRRIEEFLRILHTILGQYDVVPLDTSRDTEKIKLLLSKEKKLLIDGTEQPIRRPSDQKEQRTNYSGKKKDILLNCS